MTITAETAAVFLDGGRVAFSLVIALVFLKLGRSTHDRLYYAFSISFVLLAMSTALVGLRAAAGDASGLVMLPRLVAFLLIIASIIDKNRRARGPGDAVEARPSRPPEPERSS